MTSAVWIADWSDVEDADFRAAWTEAHLEVDLIRSKPLGTTTGTRRHRLRSYPTYFSLARRGRRRAAETAAPLVAWQPLAGALAGLLGPSSAGLVVCNPILHPDRTDARQRLTVAGARRASAVPLYSRGAVANAVALGIPEMTATFVPLGVRARAERPETPGSYLLATGKDWRDWTTLARAAEGLSAEVLVAGPRSLPDECALRVVTPTTREAYLDLVAGAAAVILPLRDGKRAAGQLALLDAFSLGRGVVATDGVGTRDYIAADRGRLVAAGDAAALRRALEEAAEPAVAAAWGRAALDAARGELSLTNFVMTIDRLATAAALSR